MDRAERGGGAELALIATAIRALRATLSAIRSRITVPTARRLEDLAVACLPIALPLGAAVLWFTSLRGLDMAAMTDVGLISILPARSFAALVVLVISFGLAVGRKPLSVPVLMGHVCLLILFLHATPTILYGTLRYSWAWKHMGMIDFIGRHGGVDRSLGELSAYHNWPGFFALGSLLTETAGLEDSLIFAQWATVLFNVLYAVALVPVFSAFVKDQRVVWVGLWFFFLTNWVGQDYFSPQAMAFFLYLAILGVVLRLPAGAPRPPRIGLGRLLALAQALGLRRSASEPKAREGAVATDPALRLGAHAPVAVLLALAIVPSHQLTPFMTAVALAALAAVRRTGAWRLAALLLVATMSWVLYVAFPFFGQNFGSITKTVGQFLENVDANLIDTSRASSGQRVVSLMGRGLTALLWLGACVGAARRARAGSWDWSVAALAGVPFFLLAGNAYGGEILFRVYLFSAPFMAYFAAAALYPSTRSPTGAATTALTMGVSLIMLVGMLFAYWGKERQYYFTDGEIAAARFLYYETPPNSLLIEGSRNYPSQHHNYEYFTYVPIASEPMEIRLKVVDRPVETISRWLRNDRYAATYMIITRAMKAEMDALGEMPFGALDRIERSLRDSPQFVIAFENAEAVVFALAPEDAGGGP